MLDHGSGNWNDWGVYMHRYPRIERTSHGYATEDDQSHAVLYCPVGHWSIGMVQARCIRFLQRAA